jgi:Na+-driven multidrug efflux pump
MAGYTSCLKVDGFNILPVYSFSLAASTFVGQNLGAGRVDRAKKGVWTTLWMSVGYTAVTSVLLLSFARSVLSIFGGDSQTIEYGVLCLHSLAPFYPLLAVIHSLAGAVRGSGKTLPPMLIILFRAISIPTTTVLRQVWKR